MVKRYGVVIFLISYGGWVKIKLTLPRFHVAYTPIVECEVGGSIPGVRAFFL